MKNVSRSFSAATLEHEPIGGYLEIPNSSELKHSVQQSVKFAQNSKVPSRSELKAEVIST